MQRDLLLAQRVLTNRHEVNELYEQAYQELLTVMQSKPRIANQALYLSRAAYNLKRTVERVTGVCEWVIFSLTGHMGRAAEIQALAFHEIALAHDETPLS
jgi:phosphate transport system protein